MLAPAETQRRRVIYAGRVQGVGFRFTVQRIAQGFAVTGFVRNLRDRKVELIAEGTPTELDRFLAEIAQVMADNIHHQSVQPGPATGEYLSFEITY